MLKWANLAAFDVWCWEEELCYSIELVASTVKCRGPLWTQYWLYVCLCQLSRGRKHYKKKNLAWNCKIDSKKTGCHCWVAIKLYLHTDIILGHYTSTHNHEIGSSNIAYMQMLGIAQEQIISMLVQWVSHQQNVTLLAMPYRIFTLHMPCRCLAEFFTSTCKACKTKFIL